MRHVYPGSRVTRSLVPEALKSWQVSFPDYSPPCYTSKRVLNQPVWADPQNTDHIRFNEMDGEVNRKSHAHTYLVRDGVPLNPAGRTGLGGRGLLGKWGPNHAVDVIVSRWGRSRSLEFLCIRRRDNGMLALPGGMIDNGESVEQAMLRESCEEFLNIKDADQLDQAATWLARNLKSGQTIFSGYVGDARNTDNSWIETTVRSCHEKLDDPIPFVPSAGSDATEAFWVVPSPNMPMHAGHLEFVRLHFRNLGIGI